MIFINNSKKEKNTTIVDIANALGISATAVSKALNGKGGISKEMQAKIREKAAEMDYKPNIIAKSLKLNQTKTLGVIVSDSSYSFFATVIKGIEESAFKYGYNIILCNTGSIREREIKALDLLISKRVDGVILAASMLTTKQDYEYLCSLNIPFVFVIRRNEDPRADYVINDNTLGAYTLTNYLLRQSSRIHFFNIEEYNLSAKDRLVGYKMALAEHGVEYDPSLILSMTPEIESGYTAMRQLMENKVPCETIFCGCDVIGIGVMEAILEKNLKIPQDIRVAGYDDIDFASYLRVPLTTVRQPKYSIGVKCVEIIMKKIKNKVHEAQHIVLKPELILRDSA